MIELKTVNVSFKNKKEDIEAVKDVSLHIKKGDIFGIVGGSGAGKSTLVRTINGLQKVTCGEVIVNGQDITKASRKELLKIRKSIGMIFQNFNLLSRKTVGQNIEFALRIQGEKKQNRKIRIEELLQLVGLQDKKDVYPRELSGGQKQRVGIARALATNPQILLCDEATSALDVKTTKEIVDILRNINKELGITTVFITHQLEVAKQLFNKIAVIKEGRIIEENNAYEIFANPKEEATKKLVDNDIVIPQGVLDEVKGDIVRLIYKGDSSFDPVIATANQKFNVVINILHGNIEYIENKPIGVLLVRLSGKTEDIRHALVYLNENIGQVENYLGEEAEAV